MRESLSIVFNFLLSSPSFDHEDSDSEHERFQKILSQKFELAQGLSHGAKIRKFIKIRHVVRVWGLNFATGLALRAMFKINMACRDGFVSNGSVLEQYYFTVVAKKKGGCFLGDFSRF